MRIAEIFYSIQGEGTKSGDAAVFVRFAGCNLSCPWCDTDHREQMDLSPNEIITAISEYPEEAMVVLTGGEPFHQPEEPMLVLLNGLEERGRFIAVETNGTIYNPKLVSKVDWITVSPKPKEYSFAIPEDDICELKYVVTPELKIGMLPAASEYTRRIYLQPLSQNEASVIKCVDWILRYPARFSLSAQLHKYLNLR
jgi:7-carboxy-7-deazaguanine synthase